MSYIQQAYPTASPQTQLGLANLRVGMAHQQQQQPLHVAYGAIAWSPASGHGGWSYCCSSVAEAERAAESEEPGSIWGCWGSNTMLALAKGPTGAYGYGWGTQKAARKAALRMCHQYDRAGVLVLLFDTRVGSNFVST